MHSIYRALWRCLKSEATSSKNHFRPIPLRAWILATRLVYVEARDDAARKVFGDGVTPSPNAFVNRWHLLTSFVMAGHSLIERLHWMIPKALLHGARAAAHAQQLPSASFRNVFRLIAALEPCGSDVPVICYSIR